MDTVRSADRLEAMTREECLRLLRDQQLGRVGFVADGLPRIEPVTYGVVEGDIVISSRPGAKLDAAAAGQLVAFEIDALEEWARAGWSVLVVGEAEVITTPAEMAVVRAQGPRAWATTPDNQWIRIVPSEISGRRVVSGPGGVRTVRIP